VTKAMTSIVGSIFGKSESTSLAICIFFLIPFTGFYVSLGGLWGVLWTDLFQFVLKMGIVIAVAYYGVRGAGGRGLLHELGLAGAPDVVMTTTLSKALGSQGGAVLATSPVRDHLIDAARPFIFDTGLAPAAVGAALAALRVLSAEPWRPEAVLRHAGALAQICQVSQASQSAVVSVILGAPEVALAAATACLDAGVRVGCFRPPTVPAGTSRLRLTARASLDADDLEVARTVLTDVLRAARL